MEKKNDGGPAFPLSIEHFEDHETHPQKGMSLRDHFAGLVLTAVMSNPDVRIDIDGEVVGIKIARNCYAMADAMLKAREQ